jgi:DNA-directed RNA polymerase specialized sigma24 family protein
MIRGRFVANSKPFQPPDYEALLKWLSPTPADAARKFQRIRGDLIRILASRGCPVPEDLADEAIGRVARKAATISVDYVGDPALYFHAVVRNVHRESVRGLKPEALEHELEAPEDKDDAAERNSRCLDRCLTTLSPADRSLILDYYSQDRADKIATRRRMAMHIGTGLNALRLRAYRIRERLFDCVTQCLQALPV